MRGFNTLKELEKYTEKYGRYKKGEIMQINEDESLVMYDGEKWQPLKAEMAESNITMSLYDYNKQLMSQMESFSTEDWESTVQKINEWDKEINATYYMMLCKEISYYTVFNCDGYEFHSLGDAVRECLEFTGDAVCVDFDNPEVVEIWIKQEGEAYCLHLFNYDNGIVSFKR